MLADSAILKEDMAWISSSDLPWDKLRNSTVLVTGATGLIGMTTVFALLAADRDHDLGLQVIALVRSPEKAERVLGSHKENAALTFLQGTMEELPQLPGRIDYWIHTACPTASAFMTAHPVEVIRTSVEGTASLLEEARKRSGAVRADLSISPAWKLSVKLIRKSCSMKKRWGTWTSPR